MPGKAVGGRWPAPNQLGSLADARGRLGRCFAFDAGQEEVHAHQLTEAEALAFGDDLDAVGAGEGTAEGLEGPVDDLLLLRLDEALRLGADQRGEWISTGRSTPSTVREMLPPSGR